MHLILKTLEALGMGKSGGVGAWVELGISFWSLEKRYGMWNNQMADLERGND